MQLEKQNSLHSTPQKDFSATESLSMTMTSVQRLVL